MLHTVQQEFTIRTNVSLLKSLRSASWSVLHETTLLRNVSKRKEGFLRLLDRLGHPHLPCCSSSVKLNQNITWLEITSGTKRNNYSKKNLLLSSYLHLKIVKTKKESILKTRINRWIVLTSENWSKLPFSSSESSSQSFQLLKSTLSQLSWGDTKKNYSLHQIDALIK